MDVYLDTERPFILARASTTKNKKTEPIPLVPELVDLLRGLRPQDYEPDTPVFPYKIPVMKNIRRDMEKMGLTYRDAMGRDLDFHALRYTWATFLTGDGISTRQLQALCRHSDPKLSANVYTDASQIDSFQAVSKLPRLFECPEHGPELRDKSGQTLSSRVTEDKKRETPKALLIKLLVSSSHFKSCKTT